MCMPLRVISLILFFLTAQQAYAQPTISHTPQDNQVLVSGLPNLPSHTQQSKWAHDFRIYVGNATTIKPNQPAVLGTYHVSKDTLIFTARYPLIKGQTYTARFRHQECENTFLKGSTPTAQTLEHTFTVAKKLITPTTQVKQIYPTHDLLPENLLKFYIYFSNPMQRGQTYAHIHLLDNNGKEVAQPFLTVTPELWSPDTQRFTLFFDPGRIKRGLMPNQDLGLALKANHTYSLVIDPSLQDANASPLTATYTKTFTVKPADRTSPNVETWNITLPNKKTHEPLVLTFTEPLDYALLQSMMTIKDPNGKTRAGTIDITHNETQWHFAPEHPWLSGAYTIHINPKLEDLAGNQLNRLFDVDVEQQPAPSPSIAPIILPFQIP